MGEEQERDLGRYGGFGSLVGCVEEQGTPDEPLCLFDTGKELRLGP